MTTHTERVDVLAVMDRSAVEINNVTAKAIHYARLHGTTVDGSRHHAHADTLREARAAVAELITFAESFKEWHANHFDNFSADINRQLLCLANDAESALARIGGDV